MAGLLESVARTYRRTDREDFLNPCQLEEEKTGRQFKSMKIIF